MTGGNSGDRILDSNFCLAVAFLKSGILSPEYSFNTMRKSLKAALFSALVFPGGGHFVLGKRVRGALLVAVSIACLYVLLSTALEIAGQISDEILSGQIPLDAVRLTEEVSRRSAAGGSRAVTLSTYLLGACWLIGIVDSWRVGRSQDRRDLSNQGDS